MRGSASLPAESHLRAPESLGSPHAALEPSSLGFRELLLTRAPSAASAASFGRSRATRLTRAPSAASAASFGRSRARRARATPAIKGWHGFQGKFAHTAVHNCVDCYILLIFYDFGLFFLQLSFTDWVIPGGICLFLRL
jgi:hypothetical protein